MSTSNNRCMRCGFKERGGCSGGVTFSNGHYRKDGWGGDMNDGGACKAVMSRFSNLKNMKGVDVLKLVAETFQRDGMTFEVARLFIDSGHKEIVEWFKQSGFDV